MSSRFERAYRVSGTTTFDAAFWNRVLRDLDTRMVGIEERKADFEEAERTLLELGLKRINETLLPAAEKIFRVMELGFLVASSDEEATFVEGETASLTIREGDQRELFTPSPFIALTRRSTTADYVIARTLAYDSESGVLLFSVETVVGNGGPHDDWDVAALAGSVQAMIAALDETKALQQTVADDKAETLSARNAAQTARNQAVSAKDDAQAARTGAENAQSAAEDAADRAETAAAEIEFPVLYAPQTLTEPQKAQARQNIGLGNSATRNVGTTAGTVAAGDDSRIIGALQRSGGQMTNGLGFGSAVASSPTNLSRHIALFATDYGFSATAGYLNYVSAAGHRFYGGGSVRATLDATGNLSITGKMTVGAAPTAAMDVATKQYVDAGDEKQIGIEQTWQDVKSARALGTSYQNTTGKPIMVAIRSDSTTPAEVSADNSTWIPVGAFFYGSSVSTIVPDGHYYRFMGPGVINSWAELR